MSAYVVTTYAAVTIPGTTQIIESSIGVTIATDGSITSAKDLGFRILGVIRIIVSGFALIYLVMIGVYMIIGSDSEETIKTQRKQITYALIGFLFLNIPGFVYTIFAPSNVASIGTVDSWSNTTGSSVFWNTAGFEGIIGNMIAFLRVFAFGVAVTMFTWGLFNLLVSGGDDEKRKQAKNRIIYGIIGLIFLGFVQLWWSLVAVGDFRSYIPSIGGTLFALVMYIAAPIAIFMLIWGAYLFITSAGDEERIKKWKSILINTGIALIILLAGLSFMTDIVTFQL
jgi:Type IV secretion system pilin